MIKNFTVAGSTSSIGQMVGENCLNHEIVVCETTNRFMRLQSDTMGVLLIKNTPSGDRDVTVHVTDSLIQCAYSMRVLDNGEFLNCSYTGPESGLARITETLFERVVLVEVSE